ncbi:MAG: rhomboid family intramembrane serine protease, partial [Stenotrophomonas koreensis]
MDNADPAAQALYDRRRLWRAFNASLAFVALLLACFAAQQQLDWRAWAVAPQSLPG